MMSALASGASVRTSASKMCESRLVDAIGETDAASAHHGLAIALEAAGQRDRAAAHFRSALDLLVRIDAHPEWRASVEAGVARLQRR